MKEEDYDFLIDTVSNLKTDITKENLLKVIRRWNTTRTSGRRLANITS